MWYEKTGEREREREGGRNTCACARVEVFVHHASQGWGCRRRGKQQVLHFQHVLAQNREMMIDLFHKPLGDAMVAIGRWAYNPPMKHDNGTSPSITFPFQDPCMSDLPLLFFQ